MDPKLLKQVVAQIHKRYPEFAGCQPKVRAQAPPKNQDAAAPNYLLTFRGTAVAKSSSGNKSISRYLRVVIDPKGKIIKVTTSR